MPRPTPKGTVIRNVEERAERLAYARDWHLRMKPHFDALYGPRNLPRPRLLCCTRRTGMKRNCESRENELAEAAGTFGIIAAIIGLVWMLGKCGPTLFPALFL